MMLQRHSVLSCLFWKRTYCSPCFKSSTVILQIIICLGYRLKSGVVGQIQYNRLCSSETPIWRERYWKLGRVLMTITKRFLTGNAWSCGLSITHCTVIVWKISCCFIIEVIYILLCAYFEQIWLDWMTLYKFIRMSF